MSLRKENSPIISLLMKSFIDVEFVPTITHIIEEVPNFKGFITSCIVEGDEALEGHKKEQQYKFFVISDGYLMMKNRIHCSDSDWLPKDGGGIKLWREDKEGRLLW
jgi:hypothetical protein